MSARPAQIAVAIPVGKEAGPARAEAEAAVAALTPSPYLTAHPIFIDQSLGEVGWRNAAIEAATRANDDWIFFLTSGERLSPALLLMVAPALRAYDAIWGGIGIPAPKGEVEIPRLARFSCSTEVAAFHMALHWWVGRSHLVRMAAAQAEPFRSEVGNGWYADYLLRHWRRDRCLKTAQPFTFAAALPEVDAADKAVLLTELAKCPRDIRVQHREGTIHLPYTGKNPTLERVQLRGIFYEAAELAALEARVPPGAVIVDVGANTGNHTNYFAAIMGAARVVPIEPNPNACAALRWSVKANALHNVDMSHLGKAAGAGLDRADVIGGGRGHLGTASLTPSPQGAVEVRPLDELVEGHIDLIKVDVEGMERDVLNGARRIIERSRPIMMIEVADEGLASFMSLLHQLGYVIDAVFPDEGYANYIVVPEKRGR